MTLRTGGGNKSRCYILTSTVTSLLYFMCFSDESSPSLGGLSGSVCLRAGAAPQFEHVSFPPRLPVGVGRAVVPLFLGKHLKRHRRDDSFVVVPRVGVRGCGRGAWFPVFLLFGQPCFSIGTEAWVLNKHPTEMFSCTGEGIGTFKNIPFALQSPPLDGGLTNVGCLCCIVIMVSLSSNASCSSSWVPRVPQHNRNLKHTQTAGNRGCQNLFDTLQVCCIWLGYL